MLDFQETTECQMKYLTSALDDPGSKTCWKCSTCLEGDWDLTDDNIGDEDIKNVADFFARTFILIEPRKKSAVTNKKLATLHENGIALSYYHEKLGQEAKRGKYIDNHFSDLLVNAAADKLKVFLRENGLRTTELVIVPIPSNRRPELVAEFAQRLSNKLKCEYEHIFEKKSNEPEQKSLLNSRQQEQNLREYLFINQEVNLNNRHILLVDDFVDSGWTFAVASDLLGEKYENVHITPFAIANTSGND